MSFKDCGKDGFQCCSETKLVPLDGKAAAHAGCPSDKVCACYGKNPPRPPVCTSGGNGDPCCGNDDCIRSPTKNSYCCTQSAFDAGKCPELHACVAWSLKPLGANCDTSAECASGRCSDGVDIVAGVCCSNCSSR